MTLCNCGKCRICTTIKKYPLKPKKKPSPRDASSGAEGLKVEGAQGGVENCPKCSVPLIKLETNLAGETLLGCPDCDYKSIEGDEVTIPEG